MLPKAESPATVTLAKVPRILWGAECSARVIRRLNEN